MVEPEQIIEPVIEEFTDIPSQPDEPEADGGAKPLFETDPLLFFMLNTKKTKKPKKLSSMDKHLLSKAKKGGAKKTKKLTPWQKHVKQVAKEKNIDFFDALKVASKTFNK